MAIKILPNGLRCGCIPSHPMALAMAPTMRYFMRDVPAAPATCQRTTGYTAWGVKGNSRYGDCVVAGMAHAKQATSFADQCSPVHDISEQEVIRTYLQLSPNDNGLNILDFLQWCESQSMPWQIGAHGVVHPEDRETQKKAIWWLGCLTLGIGVPNEWGNNPQNGFVWDAVGHFEGVCHDVEAVDYDTNGLTIITWGLRGTITWNGLREQCGEMHAKLLPDWYNEDGKCPPGLDKAGLAYYLAVITGQNPPGPEPQPPGPSPDPTPTPTPPTPVPPGPRPDPCPMFRRGMDVFRRAMDLGPDDARVQTALTWLEGYLR